MQDVVIIFAAVYFLKDIQSNPISNVFLDPFLSFIYVQGVPKRMGIYKFEMFPYFFQLPERLD
jgi:hypothetical protein